MKTVESYKDLKFLNLDAKRAIYQNMHHSKDFDKIIKKVVPNGKNVWIDSAGIPSTHDYVFEHIKWQGIFSSKDIKYYRDFYSSILVQAINKYILPNCVILNDSEEFRYITLQEITNKIKFLSTSYNAKIILCINTTFLDFNKLKYSNKWLIKEAIKNCQKYRIHTIDDFKYVYEIN